MPYSDSSGDIFSFFPDDDSSFTSDHLLAALSSTSTTCFFCHNTCHTVEACPLLIWTKSDPFAKRIVLRLLQDQPLKSARPLETRSSFTTMHKPLARKSPRVHALGLEEHNSPECFDDSLLTPPDTLPGDTSGTSDPTPDPDGELDF